MEHTGVQISTCFSGQAAKHCSKCADLTEAALDSFCKTLSSCSMCAESHDVRILMANLCSLSVVAELLLLLLPLPVTDSRDVNVAE